VGVFKILYNVEWFLRDVLLEPLFQFSWQIVGAGRPVRPKEGAFGLLRENMFFSTLGVITFSSSHVGGSRINSSTIASSGLCYKAIVHYFDKAATHMSRSISIFSLAPLRIINRSIQLTSSRNSIQSSRLS
jgi:hypothetical protein